MSDEKAAPGPKLTHRRNVLFALAGGILAGAGGGFAGGYHWRRRGSARPRPPLNPAYVPVETWNPRQGPEPAKVTLVEFFDLQCPYCERHAQTVRRLREKFADELAVVLRHRVLPFHGEARNAGRAMQAALRQGKAWEMHDLILDNRSELGRDRYVEFARQLELDVARFETDLGDAKTGEEVDADDKLAVELGATGTPSTFVNGRGVRGARPFGDLAKLIEAEIAAADELIAAGTPLADVYRKRCEANVAAGPTA